MDRPSFTFKCVLLGSAGVGKSCLVARFCRGEFIPDCDTTVGAAFLKRVRGAGLHASDAAAATRCPQRCPSP